MKHSGKNQQNSSEEAHHQREQMYLDLWDNISDLIQSVAPDGSILYVNRAWREILGYDEQEITQLSLSDIIHPDNQAHCTEIFKRLMSGEEVKNFEAMFVTKAGETIMVEGSANCRFADGKPVATRAIFRDITKRKRTEQALRASEQKYHTLIENIHDVVYCSRPGGEIYYISPNSQSMGGYKPEEIIGRNFIEFVHPDDKQRVLNDYEKSITTGEAFPSVFRLRKKDGNYIYVEELGSILMEEGEFTGITGVIRDITERKQAQEDLQKARDGLEVKVQQRTAELQQSKELFRLAAKSTSDLIYEWEVSTDRLNWFGDIDGALGFEPGEFPRLLETWAERIHPEDQTKLRDSVKLHRQSTEPIREEYRIRRKDGDWCYWADYGLPVLDNDGRPHKWIGACTDITERKRAEQALKESEEKFRTLAEQSPNMIYINKEGRIVYANKKCEELLEYKKDEFYSPDFDLMRLVAPESVELVMENRIRHSKGEDVPQYEHTIISKSGRRIEVINATKLIQYEGQTAVLGILTDITERKQSETRLLQYQSQLKSLASKLSLTEERERRHLAMELHDQIGQSLVFSKLKLDQLRQTELSEDFAHLLEEACDCLGQVIRDTRTLTFELSWPILYELGLGAAVLEWLEDEIKNKHGIEIEFHEDEHQKPLDYDMRSVLFRNIRELLVNVVKHAQAYKVKVSICKIGRDIHISVEDDGIGFDPVEARIRAAGNAKFGLFSIRERLEQLGGSMEITSEKGQGTSILMKAPLNEEITASETPKS